jgi:hypothetical protein
MKLLENTEMLQKCIILNGIILEITTVHILVYVFQIYFNGYINIFIKMEIMHVGLQHNCHSVFIGYFPSVHMYLFHSFYPLHRINNLIN